MGKLCEKGKINRKNKKNNKKIKNKLTWKIGFLQKY